MITRDRTLLGIAVVIIVLAIGIGFVMMAMQPSPQISPSVMSSVNTGNPSNDRLLAMSPTEQASDLGEVVSDKCTGVRAFYMGIGNAGIAKRKAFWSVECASGASWAVEIAPDAQGTTTVLECPMLQTIANVNCFQKFPD